jgi:hypothetical protein
VARSTPESTANLKEAAPLRNCGRSLAGGDVLRRRSVRHGAGMNQDDIDESERGRSSASSPVCREAGQWSRRRGDGDESVRCSMAGGGKERSRAVNSRLPTSIPPARGLLRRRRSSRDDRRGLGRPGTAGLADDGGGHFGRARKARG